MAPPESSKDSTDGTIPTRVERPRRARVPDNGDLRLLAAGSRLGQYSVVRRLGAGGMGAVYEAVHVQLGKAVALKVLSEELAGEPQARARFLREAEAASKIDHPNVLTVIDFGTEGDIPFIVMPLLRGEDLDHRIDACLHGLPLAEVADIFLSVCAGVFAAHLVGIVHRDLKPHNIFLARASSDEMLPKVLDFGISKVRDSFVALSLTAPGSFLGTTAYVSPEHLAGEAASILSDQYSLGVALYESVTGHLPFEGHDRQAVQAAILAGHFPRPSKLRADLPNAFESAILRALSREPSARFPTVHALGAALLPFASERSRLTWADYYQASPPGSGSLRPRPPSKSFLKKAAPAPAPMHPRAAEPAEAPESPPTMLLGGRTPNPRETRTHEVSALPRPRRSRALLALSGVLLLGLAVLFVARRAAQDDNAQGSRERASALAPTDDRTPAAAASAVSSSTPGRTAPPAASEQPIAAPQLPAPGEHQPPAPRLQQHPLKASPPSQNGRRRGMTPKLPPPVREL